MALALGAAVWSARASEPPAAAACAPAWKIVRSPAARDAELLAATAPADDDVWAVGGPAHSWLHRWAPRRTPLIEHWDGTQWSIVPGARVGGVLLDVASTAPDDIWAVGEQPDSTALAEHWDGQRWTLAPVPGTVALTGIAATSAEDIWAVGVGRSGHTDHAVVLHWDGSRWSRIVNRADARLSDVVAIAPDDAWAVGQDEAGKWMLALHWDGTRWSAFHTPAQPADEYPLLRGVAAASSGDVWAVGTAHPIGFDPYDDDPVLIHWDGSHWKRASAPGAGGIGSVAATSANRIWVTGTVFREFVGDNGAGSFLARRTGGRWHVARPGLARGQLLESFAAGPSGDLWPVGLSGEPSNSVDDSPVHTTPLVERYGC